MIFPHFLTKNTVVKCTHDERFTTLKARCTREGWRSIMYSSLRYFHHSFHLKTRDFMPRDRFNALARFDLKVYPFYLHRHGHDQDHRNDFGHVHVVQNVQSGRSHAVEIGACGKQRKMAKRFFQRQIVVGRKTGRNITCGRVGVLEGHVP